LQQVERVGIIGSAIGWIKANRVMLINTGSLVGTTAITSGLGFVYWWVAARQYTPEAVGLASAIISTMMLLGGVGMLGLGTLLITELPRQPGREVQLISTGLVVVGGVGGGIGLLFAFIAPYISPQLASLGATPLDMFAFAGGVSLSAATAVLDQALIGILQGGLQFWRNAFFSVAKLALLFVAALYLSHLTGMTIYMSWFISMALSVLILFVYVLFRWGWQGKAYLPQWGLLRKLGAAAFQHHILNLILQVPTQLLPILVTTLLTAKMNAWFYVAFMLANFVFVVPNSLTMVLHAMNSADHASLRQRARMTIGISFAVSFASILVLFVGARYVLEIFGSSYAEQATWCLRILILAAFPAIIKNHYISFCRIQDRITQAMVASLIGGILELAGTVLGALFLGGLTGLSLGWLAAVVIEGLYTLPLVYRVVWSGSRKLEIALPQHDAQVQPIWLMETAMMPAIPPLRRTSAQVQMRVPTTTLRESESIWMVDTIMLPKITPARTTPARQSMPAIAGTKPALWHAKTVMLPVAQSTPKRPDAVLPQEHKSIWEVETTMQPTISAPPSTDPAQLMWPREDSSHMQPQPPYRRDKNAANQR
jgi:O-antigen/teichoic acid export membrane protein